MLFAHYHQPIKHKFSVKVNNQITYANLRSYCTAVSKLFTFHEITLIYTELVIVPSQLQRLSTARE